MTEEKQAVKTLAENLVKAMKSVSGASSQNYVGGTTPSTISASKIVGLPAAFSSIISGVESSAAGGDAIAIQTLTALNHIAAGEFETITADTAMISKIYATFGDFIHLIAEDAEIGDLDVETLRAEMGIIGLLSLGTADIKSAQIDHLSSDDAFIRVGVGDKIYIDDLAVNDANIVSLSAGTILINDNNGDLVELYVDSTTGNVSTRAVSYDGNDIIDANSLNGNRIIQNSITADRLNASEIFAAQGTIMDLIADNIEATRLFANQGFIPQLESTIISSATIAEGLDLTNNSTITLLQDSINLLSSNASRTFIQTEEPFPVHAGDTWFDPSKEEHYVSTGIIIPSITFGHDSNGNLCNEHTDDYQFAINSDGELMVLVVNEDAERIIIDNNLDFSILNDHIHVNDLWKKIDNVAFSNLKISVDGIVSEVFDSETGKSRIEQNADKISAVVIGDTAVPHVQTSSVEIKDNNVSINSTGNVDIKANNFSIQFNTSGSDTNKSRVDISNDIGIKVSNQYGSYFQATHDKIGLYDMNNNAKLWMDANGNAVFSGSLSAATGTFSGSLSAATGTFAGTLDASCITSGTINADRIGANSISVGKLTGNITNGNWKIDLNTGTFTIGNISANNITTGTLNASNVTITNLSANSITTGTLNGNNVTITNLNANNIKAGIISDNAGKNSWNLTNGALSLNGIFTAIGQDVNDNKYKLIVDSGEIRVYCQDDGESSYEYVGTFGYRPSSAGFGLYTDGNGSAGISAGTSSSDYSINGASVRVRYYNNSGTATIDADNVEVTSGGIPMTCASGSFRTADNKTVTVVKGLITSIS